MYEPLSACGTIVANTAAARVLRTRGAILPASATLWCAGDFRTGDTVYVVLYGKDGGQRIIGTSIARCDAGVILGLQGWRHPAAAPSTEAALFGDDFRALPRTGT
jgi:hypothetical protein